MMKRKTALVLALVLVCAVVAIFLLAPGPAAPTRQKILLPDGNIVTLENVSFSIGTQHDFSFGDSALSRFGRKLPRFLRRYFPSPARFTYNTSSNSLVLWFTLADGQTGAPLDFHRRFAIDIVDEHGCSSTDQGQASMTSGGTPTIHMPTFTQFPRHQATIRVRLRPRTTLGGELKKPVVEFDVPNPARGPFPVWTPEPLPAARANGDLVFVAKDAGNSAAGQAWSGPHFDILRGSLLVEDWERDVISVSEATGNRGQRPFCTNEPAWKLEVEFLRNVKSEFLPSEMFTITNLNVPASGVAVQLTNTFSLQGKPFALCAIAGPGGFVYSNNVLTAAEPPLSIQGESSHSSISYQGATSIHTYSVRRSAPHLALVVPPLDGEDRLLLRARGPAGVACKLEPGHSAAYLWTFTLSGVATTGPFDLDVILQRPRHAEFIVKPPGKP
jgi:hypothetical protein